MTYIFSHFHSRWACFAGEGDNSQSPVNSYLLPFPSSYNGEQHMILVHWVNILKPQEADILFYFIIIIIIILRGSCEGKG